MTEGKLVYIASPYAGDVEGNVAFAKAACRYAAAQGCTPVAVHLMYPRFLDDRVPKEREAGLKMGRRVLAACEEIWLCGERMSAGMKAEEAEAQRLGIPIRKVPSSDICSFQKQTEGQRREEPAGIEKSLKEQGFSASRAGSEDIKRIMAVYYEQNVTSEKFEDFDGERWIIPND